MDRDQLTGKLVREVATFTTPALSLKEDLQNLEKVQRAGAHEAAIFYCARILESLAAAALKNAGLTASTNAYSNLYSLLQYNLFSTSVAYWANTLRRIGNDVRHILRRVEPEDAELASVFLERWLVWFFCQFRYGFRLSGITSGQESFELVRDAELRRVVEILDDPDFEPDEVLDYLCGDARTVFLKSPVLPSVLAEMLMNRQFYEQAFFVLELGLAHFPEDLRLCQLMGLYYSRTGGLDRALEWLEPLYSRFKDDEETTGILAGVYKRKWLAEKDEIGWLDKSYRAYLEGWERSRKGNAWLGANAATTALWANHPRESRILAREVEQLLQRRVETLAEKVGDSDISLDYWDRVTLAEVELLQGKLLVAWCTYCDAFQVHSERRDNVELSLEQASHILDTLGLSYTSERFRQPPPSSPDVSSFTVGVTGHRRLSKDGALTRRVGEALDIIRRMNREREEQLVVLSALAEGADRLVAECALTRDENFPLHVVLPLELADYRRDFASEESRAEFQALLDRARSFVFPPTDLARRSDRQKGPRTDPGSHSVDEREAAYEWGGRYVVDNCDLLVVLWDGKEGRGRGGTAEIVSYARKLCRPLIWIQTVPPCEMVLEGVEGCVR